MLEELNKVNWQDYHHAYGTAENLPVLIKKLASERPIVYSDLKSPEPTALEMLGYSILHQGDLYDAAIPVIPFLIELLSEDAVQNKADILSLLYEIARSWTSVRAKARKDSSVWKSLSVEREAYSLISKEKNLYEELRKSNNSSLRLIASRMLALLKRVPAEIE